MRTVCVVAICLACSAVADAQTRAFSVRGFADAGSTMFSSGKSFTAVFGHNRGAVFGGGGEGVLRRRVFVSLRASRFRRTGERVFLHGGERFGLGIPTTVTITPLELTGGYRFDHGWRVVPYAGGGIGSHRYTEASPFGGGGEDVKEDFLGYHLVGGAEIRVTRWIGTAAEVQWGTVPDALGADANSAAREFGESNLGGTTVRVKLIIGR
jgi:opacity protein-like surface antigen